MTTQPSMAADSIATTLRALVDESEIAGAATLVWRDGEVIQNCAIGWRDVDARLPVERDTLFRIASMTKPITSAAALMLLGGIESLRRRNRCGRMAGRLRRLGACRSGRQLGLDLLDAQHARAGSARKRHRLRGLRRHRCIPRSCARSVTRRDRCRWEALPGAVQCS